MAVAVDRANADVHPGTLLRTGNRTEREALANRVAAALATASNPMAWDHDAPPGTKEARAELLRATDERARLLKDITTAAELSRTLAETVAALEKHAWILWRRGRAPCLRIPSRVIDRWARLVRRAWFLRGTRPTTTVA